MIYNAMQIANYIINKCYEKKNPISNLQLQKILYYAWVTYYQETKRTLFLDNICAWPLGPVIPDVYYEYNVYGGRPINIRCETELSCEVATIMDQVVERYAQIPVNILVDMTHAKGSAWDRVFRNGEGNRQIIPFDLIKSTERGGIYVSGGNQT